MISLPPKYICVIKKKRKRRRKGDTHKYDFI